MRSSVTDILPPQVRRSLRKFGQDISIARRKRRLSVAMMTERVGISKATLQRMENGDPSVSIAAYVQSLFILGFGTPLSELIDQSNDEQGLLMELDHLPKRIRSSSSKSEGK